MSKKKINRILVNQLACDYQNGSEEAFERLYAIFEPMMKRLATVKSIETDIETDEFMSALNEKFFVSLVKWKIDRKASFSTYWFRASQTAVTDVIREWYPEDFRDVDELKEKDYKSENLKYNGRSEMELSVNKKKDQRHLVSELIERSGKNASKVIKIVNVLKSNPSLSLSEVGTLVNESKQTVQYRLKSLGKHFDENEFGRLNDYLVG